MRLGSLTRSVLVVVDVFLLLPNETRAQDTSDYDCDGVRGEGVPVCTTN